MADFYWCCSECDTAKDVTSERLLEEQAYGFVFCCDVCGIPMDRQPIGPTTLKEEVESLKYALASKSTKHFRVVPHAQYFRLTHIPSGDYIQRHLCDFLTRKDALDCRNRVIAAAPGWDWADAGLFTDMPWDISHKVWQAIYADTRRVA